MYRESYQAKCPFYRNEIDRSVTCEGIEEGMTLVVKLPDRKRAFAYKSRLCRADYRKCPIYRMLDPIITEQVEKAEREERDKK